MTAGLVIAASTVAQRCGPFLGSLVATLPLSAGPAYVFLALDHGADFVAESARASILGNAGTTAFVVAYAAVAARAGTALSIGAGLAGWIVSLAILGLRGWSTGEALAVTLAVNLAGVWATRDARASGEAIRAAGRLWHLAVRASAVMLLVGAVLMAGQTIGAKAAGSLALLPIIFMSLILILQPVAGGPAVTTLLAHGLVALLSYGPAFAVIALAAPVLGSWVALGLGLATCLGWNVALVLLRRRRA